MGWFDWLFGRPKYGGESHKAASIRSVPRHTTEGAEFGDVAGAHIRADQKSAGRNQRITENVLSAPSFMFLSSLETNADPVFSSCTNSVKLF